MCGGKDNVWRCKWISRNHTGNAQRHVVWDDNDCGGNSTDEEEVKDEEVHCTSGICDK